MIYHKRYKVKHIPVMDILNLVWMDSQNHIPTAIRFGVDDSRDSETQKRSGTPFGMPPLLSCLLSAIQNVFAEAMEKGCDLSTEFVDTLSTVRENFRDGILSLTYPLCCFIMASESTDSRDAGNCTRALLVSVWALFLLPILASLNKVSILARF